MEKPNKEDIMKKWAPILEGVGLTGSKAQWMSEYAELHSNTKIEENTTSPGGTSEEEMERIKNEVKAENRDRIIESLIEDKEYKEMDITEHPDYKGPVGTLFHLDFKYGDDTDDEEVKRSVKTLGKKKK